jgi:hypothetical protein
VKLAILLGVVTIALHFWINGQAEKYGPDVGKRWLEVGDNYDDKRLKDWATGHGPARCGVDCKPRETAADAKQYAWPVLFPYDLVFMFSLGGFLACGSVTCAQSIALLRKLAWVFAILPTAYVAADLLEDSLLARLLLNPDNITQGTVAWVQKVTAVKLVTVLGAMGQTAALALASLFPAWQAQPQ